MEATPYAPAAANHETGIPIQNRLQLLEEACTDYAHVLDMSGSAEAAAETDAAVEGMLAGVDELALMSETLAGELGSVSEILPGLRSHLVGLEATYGQIDALVALVAQLEGSVAAAEDAVSAAEKQYASKIGRKLSSFFSRRKKTSEPREANPYARAGALDAVIPDVGPAFSPEPHALAPDTSAASASTSSSTAATPSLI